MRWTAVVNPGAGRRRGSRELDAVRDALADRGITAETTGSTEQGLKAARAAFERGEGVLACGGDGTVRALAELAAAVDGLLGLVPLGAGNDFARALGFDHARPLDAVGVLDTGVETRIDLGRARTADGTDVAFTTVAHSGLDGEVNRWANDVTWMSGTALYAVAALRTMATYRPTPMRVTVDGTVHAGDTWLVSIANSCCYGGGMRIAPDAGLADGLLDVVLVGDVPRRRVVACFPRMVRGTHLAIDGVEHTSGRVITLDGPPGQDLWASGERVGPLPATLTVIPSALRMLVPADSPVRTTPRPR